MIPANTVLFILVSLGGPSPAAWTRNSGASPRTLAGCVAQRRRRYGAYAAGVRSGASRSATVAGMRARFYAMALLAALACSAPAGGADAALDEAMAARFARLALSCVHREYPNKIAHVLDSDADVRPP